MYTREKLIIIDINTIIVRTKKQHTTIAVSNFLLLPASKNLQGFSIRFLFAKLSDKQCNISYTRPISTSQNPRPKNVIDKNQLNNH